MYDAQQAIVFLFTVKYDVPSCKENLVIYVDWYLVMHCRKLSSPIFLKIGNALFYQYFKQTTELCTRDYDFSWTQSKVSW